MITTYQEVVDSRLNSYTGNTLVNDWLKNAYKTGAEDYKNFGLPDIEEVAALVHQDWIQTKISQGTLSRKAEDGEELMVPYLELSEKAKQLDRNTVIAVYKAVRAVK